MLKDKTELFETKPIPKAVAELAIPTVLSSLVMMFYNMADTYFVGILNDPIQSSAVTLAAPLLLAFNAVTNLFGVGASSVMSRALGRKDYDTVRGASAFSIYCALLCAASMSLLFAVFSKSILDVLGADENTAASTMSYLIWTVAFGAIPAILNVIFSNMVRSEGYSMHASIGVMSGCILNIILDPFFILPQFIGMGAAGAGLATFVSNSIALLYFIVLVIARKGSTYISLFPGSMKLAGGAIGGIFAVGVPASIQNLLNVTGMTILNNFTSAYGADAVAAMGISHKVAMIPLFCCMGITQGVMPLVGYNYTSGNHKRLKDSVNYVERLTVFIALIMMVILMLNAPLVISVFMKNESVVAYGGYFLRAMSMAIPFLAMDFFAVGIFQALGKGKYSLVFAITRKIVLEIPAIIILNHFYPLYGLAYSQPAAEIILAIAAVIMLKKIYKSLNLE